MRRSLFAGLLAFAFLGSGCALLRDLLHAAVQPPELRFKGASLGEVTLSQATLNLTWEITNPNAVGISLARLDYALSVEGNKVASGAPPSGLHLPASGSAELVFPATVRFQDVAPVLETFLKKDYASYRAQGTLGIDTPVGVIDLPLATEGQFEVPKVPEVKVEAPRISNLNLMGATLEVPFTVTNRNSYALPISSVSGALQIAGARVGTVSLEGIGQLAPRQPRPVTVPVTIRFLEAAQAALALRQGSATFAFNGAIHSGSASIPLEFESNVTFQR